MKKSLVGCLLLIVGLTGFGQTAIDSVYKTALSFLRDSILGYNGRLFIRDSTALWDMFPVRYYDRHQFDSVSRKTLDESEWKKINTTHDLFCKQVSTCSNYKIIKSSELKKIFSTPSGWQEFYKKYSPHGLYSVSKVLFSPDRTVAMLYADNSCGDLCGGGYIMLLSKINNKWKVTYHQIVWVS